MSISDYPSCKFTVMPSNHPVESLYFDDDEGIFPAPIAPIKHVDADIIHIPSPHHDVHRTVTIDSSDADLGSSLSIARDHMTWLIDNPDRWLNFNSSSQYKMNVLNSIRNIIATLTNCIEDIMPPASMLKRIRHMRNKMTVHAPELFTRGDFPTMDVVRYINKHLSHPILLLDSLPGK